MKKILSLCLSLSFLIAAFSGCGRDASPSSFSSEAPPTSSAAPAQVYLDGDYSVMFKSPATDRTVDAMKVTFLNEEMLITEYTCKEDSADADAAEATEAELLARSSMNQILDSFEQADGVLEDMLPVDESGMEHFYRFQRMVRSLRSAAQRGLTNPIYLESFADGDYVVTAKTPDADGYTHFIEASVQNGALTAVNFDAKNSAGDLLSAGEDASVGEIYSAIADSFMDSGDPTALVMPEGGLEATSTFVRLANPLVNTMVSGGTASIVAPNFIDGTYTAQFSDFDENGWKDIVVLHILNDEVIVKSFDAISKADPNVLRSQQTELDAQMKAATGTYTYSEAVLKIAEAFSETDNDVFAIDNVSGATVTTNNFKQLVNAILSTTARDGALKESLEVQRVPSTPSEE